MHTKNQQQKTRQMQPKEQMLELSQPLCS